jgi:hypothetical protein
VLEPPLSLESLHRALRVRVPATTVPDTEEGGAMHENPRASDEEQEEAQEGRQQEEEAMRYPEHDDPDEQRKRAHADSDE